MKDELFDIKIVTIGKEEEGGVVVRGVSQKAINKVAKDGRYKVVVLEETN